MMCIYVLPYDFLGQPNPRHIGPEILYTITIATGLQISGTHHQTPEFHSGKASAPCLQERSLLPDHSHGTTDCGIFLLCCEVIQVLYDPQIGEEANTHPVERRNQVLQELPRAHTKRHMHTLGIQAPPQRYGHRKTVSRTQQ